MRLELTGRHIRVTPSLRRLVENGLPKLDRLLHGGAVSLQVVLYEEKYRRRVEMTLHARGEHFFHGTGGGREWEMAINQALDRINKQARKLKGKWTQGKRQRLSPAKAASAAPRPERGGRRAPDDGLEPGVRIIRARRAATKPMSVDEAALEVGDAPASYLVFRNSTTELVNVLFRRPDGNLGLIEPDA